MAVDFVGNAIGAQGMPPRSGVDGDYGFAEHVLGGGGQGLHGEVGADLDDGVWGAGVQAVEGFSAAAFRDLGDGYGAFALEAFVCGDCEAGFCEKAADFGVGARHIRGEEGDGFGTELFEGCGDSDGAGADAEAGAVGDAGAEGFGARGAAVEGDRGHAHDDVIWLAGEDTVYGVVYGAGDGVG